MQLSRDGRSAQTLTRFQLTYSPAHRANGTPIDPTASRQALSERRTITVQAAHADAAVWMFERDHGRMATACKRLQDVEAERTDLEEQE
jgi:hypothetical protein